jgi:hypothetical protein
MFLTLRKIIQFYQKESDYTKKDSVSGEDKTVKLSLFSSEGYLLSSKEKFIGKEFK